MPEYIDGFVFPIARERMAEYKPVAEAVAKIYREHGAIEYLEFIGDDMNREGTRQFPAMVEAQEGETVVFGWIVYESRESRDSVNQKVESDPRVLELVGPLVSSENPVFDPSRMAFGGFTPFIQSV